MSTMAMGKGVRSWVPPRSGTTGSMGCETGAVMMVQAKGDGIRVRLRGIGGAIPEEKLVLRFQ